MEAHWLVADDEDNAQIFLRTRAAPYSTVKVEWSIWVTKRYRKVA